MKKRKKKKIYKTTYLLPGGLEAQPNRPAFSPSSFGPSVRACFSTLATAWAGPEPRQPRPLPPCFADHWTPLVGLVFFIMFVTEPDFAATDPCQINRDLLTEHDAVEL
jgi:hypothetical protein